MKEPLDVLRANQIPAEPVSRPWLIEHLWIRNAVGVIGGAPKSCKSWMGLDMAVSVASATPCLGRFPVLHPGPTLLYLAEDALAQVRERIQGFCAHRNLPMEHLDLYVIDAPCLRLDTETDQQRLVGAIERVQPRLLLLDPLVRLHRCDENSAQEMSRLLGFFRQLQRTFAMAVILVHHASKKNRAHPGQALRGSSDLHAWTDSSAYLARKPPGILLTLEHRSQAAPQPMLIHLVANQDGQAPHLELAAEPSALCTQPPEPSLSQAVQHLLESAHSPMTRTQIRNTLRVKNQTLGQALVHLQACGNIRKTPRGWIPRTEDIPAQPPSPLNLANKEEHLPFPQET